MKGVVWADQGQLVAFATAQGWPVDELEDAINALRGSLAPGVTAPVRVYAMGIDAALFGHNAVDWNTIPSGMQGTTKAARIAGRGVAETAIVAGAGSATFPYPDWNSNTLQSITTTTLPDVDLDTVYPVTAGARVVLRDGANWHYTTVAAARELTRNAYLMSAKLTSITLASAPAAPTGFGMRTTQVLVQTAALPVAGVVLDDPVGGGPLTLDGAYLSLAAGQLVVLTGVPRDNQGQTASEVTAIAGLSLVDGYTVVTFDPELSRGYLRSTVTIDANVAPATHGQAVTEILGSGDATQAFQRFPLKQAPLTYVSAANAVGDGVDPAGAGERGGMDGGRLAVRQRTRRPDLHGAPRRRRQDLCPVR